MGKVPSSICNRGEERYAVGLTEIMLLRLFEGWVDFGVDRWISGGGRVVLNPSGADCVHEFDVLIEG